MNRYMYLFVLAACGWAVYTLLSDGQWITAGVVGVIGLGTAYWVSPWQGKSTTTHREAQKMSDSSVVVYWRPGCGFCSRLRSTLGKKADQAEWINIWEDKEAAAFVRSVNEGNEVVPTVVMDGIPVTNPNPKTVLDKLSA